MASGYGKKAGVGQARPHNYDSMCSCANCDGVRASRETAEPETVEVVRDLTAADALDLVEMDKAIGDIYSCAGALIKLRNHKTSERTPLLMKQLAAFCAKWRNGFASLLGGGSPARAAKTRLQEVDKGVRPQELEYAPTARENFGGAGP